VVQRCSAHNNTNTECAADFLYYSLSSHVYCITLHESKVHKTHHSSIELGARGKHNNANCFCGCNGRNACVHRHGRGQNFTNTDRLLSSAILAMGIGFKLKCSKIKSEGMQQYLLLAALVCLIRIFLELCATAHWFAFELIPLTL
jgi:hypothetical protein